MKTADLRLCCRRRRNSIVFYNLTLAGQALLEVDGGPPILLEEVDFALIPAARRFTISSPDSVLPKGQFSEPVLLAPGQMRIGDPDLPVTTQQLVGHCTFGARDAALLLTLLPDLVVIRGEARLAMLIRLVADEARATRPGREVVLERLLEVLLIEAFRASSGITAPPGLLRGLGDLHLSIALRAMHSETYCPAAIAGRGGRPELGEVGPYLPVVIDQCCVAVYPEVDIRPVSQPSQIRFRCGVPLRQLQERIVRAI
ncbi:cupin domain-containing protein [Gemmobacter serpentinus]|uniref:cupin domain-containing protein n=1 Tax=Gemmobacter serpentinus TaxID=2652247 RepID=UPI001865801E|nr:cupin domain-containing protein [Gemmobacter serpentinus]